jgi:hypothetical protein
MTMTTQTQTVILTLADVTTPRGSPTDTKTCPKKPEKKNRYVEIVYTVQLASPFLSAVAAYNGTNDPSRKLVF